MVFRNLNGSYSSVLELGSGQENSKKIDASNERSVRVTDKEGELVPLEAAQPEQDNDVVNLSYFKDNAIEMAQGNELAPMTIELSDDMKDDQTVIDSEIIDDIGDLYPDATKNDLVTTRITFMPSGTIREVSYRFDGESWQFHKTELQDLAAANGEDPGMVLDSDDIKYTEGRGIVLHAENADTVGDLETESIITEDDSIPIPVIDEIMESTE